MTDPNEAALREIANSAYRDILNRPHESAMTHLLAALREAMLLERKRWAHPLDTMERQELYTLAHQWARNIDLQFQQIAKWIDKRTAAIEKRGSHESDKLYS